MTTETIEKLNQRGFEIIKRHNGIYVSVPSRCNIDDENDEGGWITINGTHVLTDKEGKVQSGPSSLKKETFSKAESHKKSTKSAEKSKKSVQNVSKSQKNAQKRQKMHTKGADFETVDTHIGKFGGQTTARFTSAVARAQKTRPADDAWRVSAPSKKEFEEEHPFAKCHVTKGGSTIAVDRTGDIVSACKSRNDKEFSGRDILKAAVQAGGKKLDSFAGNHGFYVECKFEPVSWCEFDEKCAPPGWRKGVDRKEPVIFYKYTGKTSKYKTWQDFCSSVPASEDYGTAYKKRDSEIK